VTAESQLAKRPLTWFLLYLVGMLAVLIIGSLVVASFVARQEAIDTGLAQSENIAREVIGPRVTPLLHDGAPVAIKNFDGFLLSRIRDASYVRIKIYDEQGKVLWSDKKSLIGDVQDIDELSLLATGGSEAEVADAAEEGEADLGVDQVIEVYVATEDPTGRPILFEGYLPAETMKRNQNSIAWAIGMVSAIALSVFAAGAGWLALRLRKRIEVSLAMQERLGNHALRAADVERRRLAQTLHDELIPDIAGMGYAIDSLMSQGHADEAIRQRLLTSLRTVVDRDLSSLRSTLVDLYPPNIAEGGLRQVLEGQARSLAQRDIRVEVDWAGSVSIEGESARLTYRVVREALRNVVQHADATVVYVQIRRDADQVHVVVSDNGVGTTEDPLTKQEGHLGLALLADTLRDLHGALSVEPNHPSGTKLLASFPINL
jgi:signal transduction histidine kinase